MNPGIPLFQSVAAPKAETLVNNPLHVTLINCAELENMLKRIKKWELKKLGSCEWFSKFCKGFPCFRP